MFRLLVWVSRLLVICLNYLFECFNTLLRYLRFWFPWTIGLGVLSVCCVVVCPYIDYLFGYSNILSKCLGYVAGSLDCLCRYVKCLSGCLNHISRLINCLYFKTAGWGVSHCSEFTLHSHYFALYTRWYSFLVSFSNEY